MKYQRNAGALVAMAAACLAVNAARAAEPVTVDNYVRAETDMTMKRYATQGAFGQFLHLRGMTPIDKQDVIRMNRDTLYSAGVFDLTTPVTILKPDPGSRFQSMMVISEDHSILPVEHGAGEFTFTRQQIGTRYVMVLFRTFADPNDPADMNAAHALQDRILVRQADAGTFEAPDWDPTSLRKIREALNVLAATRTDLTGLFGEKSKLSPLDHLLGAAAGWGGNPKEAAVYQNRVPALNDGKTTHVVTVRDVPVDGFWSITVYNAKGYMEPNPQNLYSVNNVTARRSVDGSVTVHFGGDPSSENYLPITPGWSYVVRMYQPRGPIVDGTWKFPDAQDTTVAEPEVLADGRGATTKRFNDTHMVRYIEIFLAGREAKTGNLVAACYNTMFTPRGIPASKDTAPQELVEGLDFAEMKHEFAVVGASLNGPKIWQPDWLEVEVGVERNFNGLPASWVAQLNMAGGANVDQLAPYKPLTIVRKSGLGWNKGTTVLILDDAEGNTWVMKGFQVGLTPTFTYDEFVAAGQGQFKKLPPGWKFRVKTLEKDLIETPENGVATIMPDEFFNVYDKTGPGMSNYQP